MSKQPEGIVRRITRQQWDENWEMAFNTPKNSPQKLLSDAAKYKGYLIKKLMEGITPEPAPSASSARPAPEPSTHPE